MPPLKARRELAPKEVKAGNPTHFSVLVGKGDPDVVAVDLLICDVTRQPTFVLVREPDASLRRERVDELAVRVRHRVQRETSGVLRGRIESRC